jgi:hypothetical protein
MKNYIAILFAIVLLNSCKKEEQAKSYNKYDVCFSVKSNLPLLNMAWNNSVDTILSSNIPSNGLEFCYGNLTAPKELLAIAYKPIGDVGFVKISWKIKDVVMHVDSVFMPDSIQNANFIFNLPQ